jgi:hypothetical protein
MEHPEVARFRREFDTTSLPESIELQLEPQRIRGEVANTDWSRLGLATGAFFGLLLIGAGMIYIPVMNYLWAAAMLVALLALPWFGARAALFRLREGRRRRFDIEFREDGPPRWHSSDDRFWRPVKDFFKV